MAFVLFSHSLDLLASALSSGEVEGGWMFVECSGGLDARDMEYAENSSPARSNFPLRRVMCHKKPCPNLTPRDPLAARGKRHDITAMRCRQKASFAATSILPLLILDSFLSSKVLNRVILVTQLSHTLPHPNCFIRINCSLPMRQ